MKRFLLIAILVQLILVVPNRVAAKYDFVVAGIYYAVLSMQDKTCTVVNPSAPNRSNYSGSIIIPSTIQYNGRSFMVKEISERAFYYSTITDVDIPGSVDKIRASAFLHSKNLKRITIREGTRIIEREAFAGCSALKTLILPNTIQSIGIRAFHALDGDYGQTLRIPSSCKFIDNSALPKGAYELYLMPSKSSIVIEDGNFDNKPIIHIGRNIDNKQNQYSLLSFKTLVEFYGECTRIPNLYVSSNQERTKAEDPVEKLIIGEKVTSIHDLSWFFIKNIQIHSDIPPRCEGDFSNSTYARAILSVPNSSVYKQDPHWKKFWNIKEVPSLLRTSQVKASENGNNKVKTANFNAKQNKNDIVSKHDKEIIVPLTVKRGESLVKDGYEIFDAIGYKKVMLFGVEINGETKLGFVNGYIEVLVEPVFDDATSQSYYGMWCVKRNGRWGAYDETIRKLTIECQYDWMGYWTKGEDGVIKVEVEKDGKRFWIDKKGNRI